MQGAEIEACAECQMSIDFLSELQVTHMPPELLTAGQLSKAADSYAFGTVLWELLTGERPWGRLQPMQVCPRCSDASQAFLCRCYAGKSAKFKALIGLQEAMHIRQLTNVCALPFLVQCCKCRSHRKSASADHLPRHHHAQVAGVPGSDSGRLQSARRGLPASGPGQTPELF